MSGELHLLWSGVMKWLWCGWDEFVDGICGVKWSVWWRWAEGVQKGGGWLL